VLCTSAPDGGKPKAACFYTQKGTFIHAAFSYVLETNDKPQQDSISRIDEEQSWASITELYYRYDAPAEFEESDCDTVNAQEKETASKLRKAASLEVLKAYGGCFASGFLALQDPLPKRSTSKLRSYESVGDFGLRRGSETTSIAPTSSDSSVSLGWPRPDSATLVDKKSGRKWSWKGMRRSGKKAADRFLM
jgi:hypothetical protein